MARSASALYHCPIRVTFLFRQNARMVAQVRAGGPRIAGVAKKKDARPLAEPPARGAVGPGEAEKAQMRRPETCSFAFKCSLSPNRG